MRCVRRWVDASSRREKPGLGSLEGRMAVGDGDGVGVEVEAGVDIPFEASLMVRKNLNSRPSWFLSRLIFNAVVGGHLDRHAGSRGWP